MLSPARMISTTQGDVYFCVLSAKSHRKKIGEVLSDVLGQKIEGETMPLDAFGRPDFSTYGLDVNWTHSRGICVLAYSFDAKVGVDLEFHKKRTLRLAKRFFNPEEVAAIEEFNEESLAQGLFYTLWCRKEAYFKCFGGHFFEEALAKSMLAEDASNYSFIEPSLGLLEGDKPYSFCIISATK